MAATTFVAWEIRMSPFSARAAIFLAISVIGLSGGCTRLKGHQGYLIDADLVNSVQPGVDTRASVAKVLGKPTFAGQFDESEWFYVSRETQFFAYNSPKAKAQTVLRIRFDDKGVVSTVDRTGLEQVAAVRPFRKSTPTLGRNRSLFDDLFGNIGAVGAGGGGGPGGGGPGGGGGGGGGGRP